MASSAEPGTFTYQASTPFATELGISVITYFKGGFTTVQTLHSGSLSFPYMWIATSGLDATAVRPSVTAGEYNSRQLLSNSETTVACFERTRSTSTAATVSVTVPTTTTTETSASTALVANTTPASTAAISFAYVRVVLLVTGVSHLCYMCTCMSIDTCRRTVACGYFCGAL
jgi:hypothetical protein